MMTQTGEAHRLPVLKERHLPGECRQSVTELLKETYGYDGFRNLEIYDDLFKNRDTLCISQGQLVENVIREAEKAYKGVQRRRTARQYPADCSDRCGKVSLVSASRHPSGKRI